MHFYFQYLRNISITSAQNKSNTLLFKKLSFLPNCITSLKTMPGIIPLYPLDVSSELSKTYQTIHRLRYILITDNLFNYKYR